MIRNRAANKTSAQSGFGIIEALVALAAISLIVVAVNKQFLGNRENTAIRKARALFDVDMVRLMMVTEENNVCERLNIIGRPMPGRGNKVDLDRLTYGSEVLFERHAVSKATHKDKALYRIKTIKLEQTSDQFGIIPKRARAEIQLEAAFFNPNGQEIKIGDARRDMDTKGFADIIIASRDGAIIDSCYGIFSRRIACTDENKTYNPEGDPSCT